MTPDLFTKSQEYARHMAQLCGLPVSIVEPAAQSLSYCTHPADAFFCNGCRCDRCNKLLPFLYGSGEAFRWDGLYTYYCPAGFTFIASAILDTDYSLLGALVAGPCIMGEQQDTLQEIGDEEQRCRAAALPVLTTGKVGDYASLLRAVSTHISGVLHTQRQGALLEQSLLLNSVYEAHTLPDRNSALVSQIHQEKNLHDQIISQDKKGAQDTLNELLGYIYFSNDFDLERIRIRVTELLVLLSRASVDAGANIQQVFAS